jgi:hypothetical protein
MLITHDTAGDGGNPLFTKKLPLALYALHRFT